MEIQQSPYETSDYHLAVVLSLLGFKLTSVDKSGGRRAVFNFDHDPEITKFVEAFFRDELKLNPRSVLTTARLVKDRLYAAD